MNLKRKLREAKQTLKDLQADLPKLQHLQRERQHQYESAKQANPIADDADHLKAEAELESINHLVTELEQDIAEQQNLITSFETEISQQTRGGSDAR